MEARLVVHIISVFAPEQNRRYKNHQFDDEMNIEIQMQVEKVKIHHHHTIQRVLL